MSIHDQIAALRAAADAVPRVPRAPGDEASVRTWLRERADRLAAQATSDDPATVTVPVQVYVREPGPEVTEVEDSHGLRLRRAPRGWTHMSDGRGASWQAWAGRGFSLHPVGTRKALRRAGEGR